MLKRLAATLGARANALLDRYDDPREAVDLAFELELSQLSAVQRAIVDVRAAEDGIRVQTDRLQTVADDLRSTARHSLMAEEVDAAREALARSLLLASGSASLTAGVEQLDAEEHRFVLAAEQLGVKLSALSAGKEAMKVRYSATGVAAEINDVVEQIRAEVSDIAGACERAEGKAAELRAKALEVELLLASGELTDLSRPPAGIDQELGVVRRSAELERSLQALRA
ncbi:MAG TPA: hypothetical protein VGP46_12850 [Acidimicrobiales bacterium]|nr:hypothetical protein [Acidimicrobiales bacterium]